MDFDLKLKEEIANGDYKSDNDDEYVKMLEEDKREYLLKIGMGAFYIVLLVISLLIV